ncbi:galactose-specific lectin nattectin-like isoform X2 [Xiphophorus couchianus]|uniref:galactose-specific lectin nattectin-like isoform X2 n=1 Tax=Xiphophorus couchianus TaxID=32473 RepID=UPI001016F6E0|nr:galactose-specific lectin nattectin-like isoform X2 [Xiphophorus couchianus]
MAAGLVFTLLLGLSFGLWDGADACQLEVADCDECTPGWAWYDGRCFLYVNVKQSWADAEILCVKLDGNLASMTSRNEYDFVRKLIYNATGQNTQTWVGAHDSVQEGIWMWSDGSKFLFDQWSYGQPNNFGGVEHCMDINLNGRDYVNDDVCSKELPFICVRPLYPSHDF